MAIKRIDGIYALRPLRKTELTVVHLDPQLMAAILETFNEPQLPKYFRMERKRRGF